MPRLGDPITIGGLRVANRLVMAPMVTGYAADHAPTERQIAWYVERARNGIGLVIVEAAAMSADGLLTPAMLGIWDDTQIPALRRLVQAVHGEGVPLVQQIVHGGVNAEPGAAAERVGPSAVRVAPGAAPRPLTVYEIGGLVEAFAAAAARVREAGYDGVEIHAAHYYLLSQFLSPYCNRRDDGYGGDLAGRARFLLEVVRAVRARVGADYPIFCRIHCVERVPGGLSTAEAATLAMMVEGAGVDVIDASAIGMSKLVEDDGAVYLATSSALAKELPAGANAAYAGEIKRAVGVPVIAVGKLGDGALAQRVLDEGQADLIAIGRQLIADPLTPRKMLAGREAEILRCRECFTCRRTNRGGRLTCSVNKTL